MTLMVTAMKRRTGYSQAKSWHIFINIKLFLNCTKCVKTIDIFRNILYMQTPNRNYNGRNNFMRPLKMSLDN